MKINNISLIEVLKTLNKFNQVTGKLGYAISKAKKEMMKQLEPFEEERYKLLQRYGQTDESGNLKIEPDSKNFEKFIQEFRPLAQEILIEINPFNITREEFEGNESLFEIKDANVNDFDLLQTLFIKDKTQQKTE